MNPYTPERINEIMKDMQEALKEADNFPAPHNIKEYKKFWVSLRKNGSALFGLANYLIENK